MTGADVLAVVASGVFLARLLPQPVRLARSGVAAGVSALAALNAVIVAVAWVVYGLQADLLAVWLVSVLALVPGCWTVALLRREVQPADVALAGAWVAVLVAAALAGVSGVALAVGVVVTQGPQVLQALRQRDLRGISPATWWISLLDAATWGAYGVAVADGALVGYAIVLTVSAAVVLGRVWWTRRLDLEVDVAVA